MKTTPRYQNRTHAGRVLAAHVQEKIGTQQLVVLALARGGVPVGYEIASALKAPLEAVVVRKLGVPGQSELAMGAIAPDGIEVLNDALVRRFSLSPFEVASVADRERTELQRRENAFRSKLPATVIQNRIALLVDDGLATGLTLRAAIVSTRARHPARLVVAVPVGAAESCEEISREVDLLICPLQPEPFHAVGFWYADFSQTSDAEIQSCLASANERAIPHAAPDRSQQG